MRITKLHILILILLAGLGANEVYKYNQKRIQEKEKAERLVLEKKRQEEEEELKRVAEAQAAVAASSATQTQAAEPVENKPVQITYTVQAGDTLWSIAQKKEHFGAGHRWYDIWKANEGKIFDFDHLVRGQELTIPLDKPEGYAWPKTKEGRKQKILKRPGHWRKVPVTN